MLDVDKGLSRIHNEWIKIKWLPLTVLSTSSGMRRGDILKTGNMGGNGHTVICEILDEMGYKEPNLPDDRSYACFKKQKALIEQSEISIEKYVASHQHMDYIFTFADKVQWGGSREIYIQTVRMKADQYRIEKLLAEFAKYFENELIHIKSDARMDYIYRRLKRKDSGYIRYYLTLDCRRWAPLSNNCKYIEFINVMGQCLPSSFMNLFNTYMDGYFTKKSDVIRG